MPPRFKYLNKYALIAEAYTVHGRTLREIALFYGICYKTVCNILDRQGVERRYPGRRLKENTPDPYKPIKKEE